MKVEKQLVLNMFDAVYILMVELEEDAENIQSEAAEMTKFILSKHSHFSELSPTSILRWSNQRERINIKPGRKIDIDFEADVLRRLMITELLKEKNVSPYYYFIYIVQRLYYVVFLPYCRLMLV